MAIETTVELLRPEAIRIQPVLLDAVFDEPRDVISLIEERAPYPTLMKFHGMVGDDAYAVTVLPWFRTVFRDDLLLRNSAWVEGARAAFGARIVEPLACVLNIQPAAPAGVAHLDLPAFRGSHQWPMHVWLLNSMGNSGLFGRWMLPIASGLVWFYRGVGGEFEYWPEGPEGPMRRQEPRWNVGQVSDNEYMPHRVAAIGRPEDVLPADAMSAEAQLHFVGDGRWEIRDRDDVVRAYDLDDLRISLLWKAYAFEDERQLASFHDHDDDLDIDRVSDVFCADLERRGIPFERPADPFTDRAWQKLLVETYPPPLPGPTPSSPGSPRD